MASSAARAALPFIGRGGVLAPPPPLDIFWSLCTDAADGLFNFSLGTPIWLPVYDCGMHFLYQTDASIR
jgi:hypothetical protein